MLVNEKSPITNLYFFVYFIKTDDGNTIILYLQFPYVQEPVEDLTENIEQMKKPKPCISLSVIKQSRHLSSTLKKICRKQSPVALVFYISLTFSNASHVLSLIHSLGFFMIIC